jgi:DNA-binding transcriptional regulator YiaG
MAGRATAGLFHRLGPWVNLGQKETSMTAEFFDRSLGGDDTLGGRLSLARDALDVSVGEVARVVGVETDTLRYWENDQAEPRANKLSMLAGVLQVSLSWLLTGIGHGPNWEEFAEAPSRLARPGLAGRY